MSKEQKHFKEILEDFSNAMLVTIGTDAVPTARPMRIADVADDSVVWFVTNIDSGKIHEIESNPTVGVTLQGGSKFLSLSGKASVVRDQAKIDELWSDAWKIWFPDGKTDSSIALLKIDPTAGEYWDHSGTKRLQYLYEAGKAYFSGEEVDTESLGGNAKVQMG